MKYFYVDMLGISWDWKVLQEIVVCNLVKFFWSNSTRESIKPVWNCFWNKKLWKQATHFF